MMYIVVLNYLKMRDVIVVLQLGGSVIDIAKLVCSLVNERNLIIPKKIKINKIKKEKFLYVFYQQQLDQVLNLLILLLFIFLKENTLYLMNLFYLI